MNLGIFARAMGMGRAGLGIAHRGAVGGLGMAGRALNAYGTGMLAKNPTMWGGTLGAAYGAYSDDTSVLGGAAMGAGLGRYGFAGGRLMNRAARLGINDFRGGIAAFGRGAGRQGRADWLRAYTQGRRASGYIASTTQRAFNWFKGLHV